MSSVMMDNFEMEPRQSPKLQKRLDDMRRSAWKIAQATHYKACRHQSIVVMLTAEEHLEWIGLVMSFYCHCTAHAITDYHKRSHRGLAEKKRKAKHALISFELEKNIRSNVIEFAAVENARAGIFLSNNENIIEMDGNDESQRMAI